MRSLITASFASLLLLTACGGDASETDAANAGAPAPTTTAENQHSDGGSQLIPAPEGSLAANPMVIGDPDAPLTIVEYGDLACGACARFHKEIFPRVKRDYIDTGKVKFEFREYPILENKHSYAGFYLARCTATTKGPEAYFGMVGVLFDKQMEWLRGARPGQVFENAAAQAGLNRDAYRDCLYREDIREAVKQNVLRAKGAEGGPRVGQTPTFLIDNEIVDWGYSEQGMVDLIEAELAKRS